MGLSRRPRGPLPWRRALETLALTVCLGVWIQSVSAQGAATGVIDATMGDSATLPAPVTADILSFSWYRGTVVADPQQIYIYFISTSKQVNGPQYTGRETGRPDGSLVIRDILTNYTGNYTVSVTPNGALAVTATRFLKVYEYVPTVAPKPDDLSGGAIAGIVIAALVVVAGVAALVYFFVFKKPASGAAAGGNTGGNTTEMAPKISDGSANGAAPEIQYSSVNFVPKKGTPAKPIAPENTVYSEVRR